jgi:hypothetical protein
MYCLYCLPHHCPRRLNEVAQELEGRLLYGSREDMDCGEPPAQASPTVCGGVAALRLCSDSSLL